MEATFHIVGTVLSSRPAPELIDALVAQVRRERGAVLVKSAQSATFVRFGASDAKLVSMACDAACAPTPVRLRFGFAGGAKENGGSPTAGRSAEGEGLDVSTRVIVQANDLAAAADDGEVLVSPQLAVWMIEAGLPLRSKQVGVPDGRSLPACVVEWVPDTDGRANPAGGRPGALVPAGEGRPRARAAGGLAPLSGGAIPPAAADRASAEDRLAPLPHGADALAQVFQALKAQAEEIARRQGELEARQDAVLGKMTLVDEGSVSARHLDAMEAELVAQVTRVEARLDFIDKLEQRVGNVVSVIADVERRLSAQLHRRGEVESLKVLCDTLLSGLVEAQPRLEAMAGLQERLLPMREEIETLAASAAASERALAAFEARLSEVGLGIRAAEARIDELADRQALLQALKEEVERLREIGERGRADLQHVADRQGELAAMREKVDSLLGRVEETDSRIGQIESRRPMVEEAQASVNHITHLLGDIQLKLELLNEQRVVVEHVGDKLARLDFTVQEAQNTLRALQREREVAERVEQGIRSLRARAGASQAT